MPRIETLNVSQIKPDNNVLWGCRLDRPNGKGGDSPYMLEMRGWALGRNAPVAKIEFGLNGVPLDGAAVITRRPDIAAAFRHVPNAERSGFEFGLSSLELPEEFKISVEALLADGGRAAIAALEGRRALLRPAQTAPIQPVLITTLGRSGSTWLTQLLGKHPEILTYRPFECEPRVGTYWLAVLTRLSRPQSFMQCLGADLSDRLWWAGRDGSVNRISRADPELIEVLAEESVRDLADLCVRRVDGFYARLAKLQGKPDARFFAEKAPCDLTPILMRELYPDCREIFLVRDFRDTVSSVLAFNAKRGVAEFDRASTDSDEDYVRHLREAWAVPLLQSWRRRLRSAWLVRYEDLILRPDETLEGMFKYIGVSADPSQVHSVIESASQETPGMRKHRTATSAKASIGRWRVDLSPALQAACDQAFGDILPEFGYNK